MHKRTLLSCLLLISMLTLTFPISQAYAQGMAASCLNTAPSPSHLSHPLQEGATSGHRWRTVKSPSRGPCYNNLSAVAVVSANDIWAVGSYNDANDTSQTLTEHWNGTRWSIVASPDPSSNGNVLNGVAAVSAQDVWAVGYYDNSSQQSQTLVEHWNGKMWSIVASPNSGQQGILLGVAAVSAKDVWAVGNVIERWNGTKWSIVSGPLPYATLFQSVAAISATDVWAVGNYYKSGAQTLTEHWNGSKWSVVASPTPGDGGATLYGVATVSGKDVWAVGDYIMQGYLQTLIEQWNGTSWSVVFSPNPGGSAQLNAVATVSANDVWAVGNSNSNRTLIVQWNGTSWSAVASPNIGPGANQLSSVMTISAGSAWAVGFYYSNGGPENTLTERYS